MLTYIFSMIINTNSTVLFSFFHGNWNDENSLSTILLSLVDPNKNVMKFSEKDLIFGLDFYSHFAKTVKMKYSSLKQ